MKTPLKPCRKPGCRTLHRNANGFCDKHDKEQQQKRNDNRPPAHKRGYDWEWHKFRNRFLEQHPLCECSRCQEMGRLRVADIVHHIQSVDVRPDLKFEETNLVAMSKSCHEAEHGRKRDFEYEKWQKDENRNQIMSK